MKGRRKKSGQTVYHRFVLFFDLGGGRVNIVTIVLEIFETLHVLRDVTCGFFFHFYKHIHLPVLVVLNFFLFV